MRRHREIPRATRVALRAAAVLLGCAAAPAAHGREGNVFTPYAALSLTMDTNLFRLPADVAPEAQTGRSERGDLINSNQVGLRGDRLIGRQRLSFDVSVNQSRYRTYTYLNSDLINGSGTWGWQLGHDLSGELGTVRSQSLTGFSDVRSSARNVSTVTVNRATLNYNLQPSWRLVGGLYETTLENSSAERTGGNFKTDAFEAGVTYAPATGNRLTLRARGTRASYPNEQNFLGVKVNNDYTQYDLETEVYWQVTGQSQLSFLLASTRRHYPDLPQRDFNGPAGRAIWDWQASGKTMLELSWRREIGAFQDITDNYIVTDTLATSATYQAGAKSQVQGRLYDISRRFLGDPGFVLANIQRRTDHVKGGSLALNYDATRALRLSATVLRESRSSNTAGFNYDDTSATLSLQLNW